MEKYGHGSVPSSLAGVSPASDANDVQQFMLAVTEHRMYFGQKSTNEADQFSEIIMPLLDSFAQSDDPESLRNYGKQIVVNLSNIASIIKRLLDSKRETYR